VQKNADYDILTKLYFPRAYTEESRELDTSLIIVGANSSQQLGKREASSWWGLGNSFKEGLQTKQKDHHSLSTPICAQSSYTLSSFLCRSTGQVDIELSNIPPHRTSSLHAVPSCSVYPFHSVLVTVRPYNVLFR
jgi:hypothetical protein